MHGLEDWLADPSARRAFAETVEGKVPVTTIRDAKIKITSRCNLRCGMCDYWKTRDEETLSTDAWRRCLDELAELGVQKVHFSGGEPFLRRDFVDVVEHACGLGLRVNLTTNGTIATEDAVARLVDAGIRGVSLSLDGPTAELHDAIRGIDGAFEKTVQRARWFRRRAEGRKRPLRVRINVVVMRRNYRRLPALVELAGSIGADDVVLMPIDETGPPQQRLSAGQMTRFDAEVAPQILEAKRRFAMPDDPSRVHVFGSSERDRKYAKRGLYARGRFERGLCYAPWLHVFVAWDGAVYLCCMTTERMAPLGWAGRTPMADIVAGPAYRAVRESFLAGDHHPMCHRCDLFDAENRFLADAVPVARPATRRRLPLASA